jgi:F-type H+-transporting ATPase subunit gamma
MSDTLASLSRKINGAEKLEAVVRTMKAMAASSIGQYEAAVRALEDYESTLELGLSLCLKDNDHEAIQEMERSSDRMIGAIVFGSDQGLVGRFNEVIVEFAQRTLAALPGNKEIWAIGDRVRTQLECAGLTVAGQFTVPNSVAAITPLVSEIQLASETRRAQGQYGQVYVFHNRPRPAMLYEPISQRLLPLDEQWRRRLATLRWPTGCLPEAVGGMAVTLGAFVREYLFISLYKASAESLESENASRLAAMQRAEKNIAAMTADMRQSFYRLRQSSIDEELFDVIAGFSAASAKT